MPRTKSFDEEKTLDRAKDLFWMQGYSATPPQDILDDTGLSRSSLYDTYGDKHTLFLKTLRRYRVSDTGGLIAYLDNAEDPAWAIRQLFQSAHQAFGGHRFKRGCFMINTIHELVPQDREVAAIISENRQALEDAYTRAVRRGQQQGNIRTDHSSRALGRFLLNSLWGLTTQIQLGISKKVADDIVRLTLAAL